MHWEPPPPLQGAPCALPLLPWRPVPASMAFVTDSNRPNRFGNLLQPPVQPPLGPPLRSLPFDCIPGGSHRHLSLQRARGQACSPHVTCCEPRAGGHKAAKTNATKSLD